MTKFDKVIHGRAIWRLG